MTQHHPLTDEMCIELSVFDVDDFISDGHIADMRTAADWQLKQVIQFLEANKALSVETALRFIRPAMRPRENYDEL